MSDPGAPTAPSASIPAPALLIKNLSKSFGGQRALDGVSFSVRRGEVAALLGENGSGKSTLVKVLAGFYEPERGSELELDGSAVPLPVPSGHFREVGLSFVFQDLGLASGLNVTENLFVGRRAVAGTKAAKPIRWHDERRKARATFSRYEIDIDPAALVHELAPTEQALLAIARAAEELREFRAAHDGSSGVLVLDEPTVFLPETERVFLLDLVRRIATQGTAVLFVSHDLTSVRGLCSRALVLRDGRLVGDVRIAETDDEELVRLISSPDASVLDAARTSSPAVTSTTSHERKVALAVRNARSERLHGIDFDLLEGEVLGVAGLLGSGSDALPYTLFGALSGSTGQIVSRRWAGELSTLSPRRAIEAGFALVPADRHHQSVVGSLSVEKNLLSLVFDRFYRRGMLSHRQMHKTAAERVATYRIRIPSPVSDMVSLSGGNQQKVVLAKWLERQPTLLLLHEPTQGVDVATRSEIYRIVRDLTLCGTAALWVSTDFDELAVVSDRILVVESGVVATELRGAHFTHDEISSAVYAASAGRSGQPTQLPLDQSERPL